MKSSTSRSSRLLRRLSGLAAVGLLLGAARAGGGPPGGGSFSDEMVGTLPSTGGWTGAESEAHDPAAAAGFYVEGAWQDVVRLAMQVEGAGHASFDAIGGDDLRATFHGEVSLDVLGSAFAGGTLRAGVVFGGDVGVGAVALFSGGRFVSQGVQLAGSELEVPMTHLLHSGALAEGLQIVTWNALDGRATITLSETAGLVHVAQGS